MKTLIEKIEGLKAGTTNKDIVTGYEVCKSDIITLINEERRK